MPVCTGWRNHMAEGNLLSSPMIMLLKITAFIALVYVLPLLMLFIMQREFIYITKTLLAPVSVFKKIESLQEVTAVTEDGMLLTGWFVPPADADKPVIVFFHGNASNLSMSMSGALPYIREGYGYLVAEYRGYSGNDGKPSEKNLYKDARGWIDYLKGRGHKEQDMVLFGESLGSGVAVQMALEYKDIRAIVLISPYTRLVDVAKKHYPFYPVHHLMRDKYANIEKVRRLQQPVFIIHGGRDHIVPVEMSQELYESVPGPKSIKIIPQSGHNDLFLHHADDYILMFLQSLNR